MKENLKQQLIGQKVQRVTYFEINYLDQPFFYDDFDYFDLGINIEFSSGFHWHIGWKDNDCPETGTGMYSPEDYFDKFAKKDATGKWSPYLTSKISEVEIEYVTEVWKIPARCTFHFENSESVTIILGEELNLDGSLPLPLKYVEGVWMYVFHSKGTLPLEIPPTELVKIVVPVYPYPDDEPHPDNNPKSKVNSQSLIGVLILFILTCLIVLKVAFGL